MFTKINLSKKVVIVTGASSGIGRTTAISFIKKGAIVIATARRENLLKEIHGAEVIPCDLRDIKQIENLVNKTVEKYGTVDILVNVAGIGWYNWIEKLTPDEIKEQYDTNITSIALLISKVVPYMKKQKSGQIINVSSYASRIAIPPITIYSSTKYAIEGLTDALRRELAPWKIKLTRVHPWSVDTDFNAKAASNNGIIYPNKFGVPFMKLTQVSADDVAKEIINAAIYPKRSVYVTKFPLLINFISYLNYFFPAIVDFFYGFYVRQMIADTKEEQRLNL